MYLLNASDGILFDMGSLGRQWTWLAEQHKIVLCIMTNAGTQEWTTGFLIDDVLIYERKGQSEPLSEWMTISSLLLEYNIVCRPLTLEIELPLPVHSLAPQFS